MVFDYNRDGLIGDDDVEKVESGEATFRFWINNDNDSGDTNESENDRPGYGRNYDDDIVNGRCDLLDFTPVWVDLSEVFPRDMPDSIGVGLHGKSDPHALMRCGRI